ncbi:MAG: succinate dehydrogenase cytochrome b subunit [Fibrobacterales bacterium]
MEATKRSSVAWIGTYLTSSVGKKQLMAVTGLLWVGFLLNHMAGNIPLMFSEEAFNRVAYFYASNKILMYGGELLLGSFILIHILLAIITWVQNRKARPVRYQVVKHSSDAGIASYTMIYTGVIMAVFLVLHIKAIKYGDMGMITYDGVEMANMYALAAGLFADWTFSLFYAVAMVMVGLHVSHALQSAAQTFGLNHSKFWGIIQGSSKALGLIIGLGNITITTVMFIQGAK